MAVMALMALCWPACVCMLACIITALHRGVARCEPTYFVAGVVGSAQQPAACQTKTSTALYLPWAALTCLAGTSRQYLYPHWSSAAASDAALAPHAHTWCACCLALLLLLLASCCRCVSVCINDMPTHAQPPPK